MSRFTVLLVMVVIVAAAEAIIKLPSTTTTHASCRYWCKKQLTGRAYCCDDEVDDAGEKSGICPPVRDFCPQSFHHGLHPPPSCTRDKECKGKDKCCYDVCLQHRTCKPSQEPVVPLGHSRN